MLFESGVWGPVGAGQEREGVVSVQTLFRNVRGVKIKRPKARLLQRTPRH